jgi:hypothetical protein
VLGYHRPVDVAGIGEDHIAIHEFGKTKTGVPQPRESESTEAF